MVAIIAHRGARSLAPENTLAAARKAHAVGADLWETDVAVTADDRLVLMHDDSMMRTTDVADRFPDRVPAPFSTYTLAEIRSLDAGASFERDDPFGQVAAGAVERSELLAFIGEKVPTLREAFELTLELDWFLNLELKAQPKPKETFDVVSAVLALADEVGIGPDHLLFSSAQHAWLKALKQRRPEFEVQAILGLFPEDPIDFSDPFFDTFNPRITRVSIDQIEEQLARGTRLNPYTVNDPESIARLIEMGITGLITDFPQPGHGHDVPHDPAPRRFCIVNCYPAASRENFDRFDVGHPHDLFRGFLRREAPNASAEIVYVADPGFALPPGTSIDDFDGFIWTGSDLTVYHTDDPRVAAQIAFAERADPAQARPAGGAAGGSSLRHRWLGGSGRQPSRPRMGHRSRHPS